jgi:anthranilate phosphoribosyltransferase
LDKDTDQVEAYFAKNNFVFLYAQKWHASMKAVSKVRKELGVRTIFNILGPLINPFSPKYMVLGVYKKELGFLFASTLKELKVERAWVVHGKEGLDEISPAGESIVWELKNGNIREFEISPEDFGLSRHSLDTVKGNRQDNKRNMEDLLMGEIKDGPLLEYVLMNTSALLLVSGIAKDLKDGVEIAKDSIYSCKAWNALQEFKEFTIS